MNVAVRTNDRFITVDGLNIRYLEEGSGVPAILLHGSSLGSSADVFRRNLTLAQRDCLYPRLETFRAYFEPVSSSHQLRKLKTATLIGER